MIETKNSLAAYDGNGTTIEFPFYFKIWDKSQLQVTVQNPAGNFEVVTSYEVILNDDGGYVRYLHNGAPLATGWRLAITRDMDFLQSVDLISGTRFDPQVVEEALDKATAERQQLLEIAKRAIKMPATSTESPENFGNQLITARAESLKARADASEFATNAEQSAENAKQTSDKIEELHNAALVEIENNVEKSASLVANEGDIQIQRLENATIQNIDLIKGNKNDAIKDIEKKTNEVKDDIEREVNRARVYSATARNAAQEANAEAERAEKAASDSETAAEIANNAYKKVHAEYCLRMSGLVATINNADELEDVPGGFYVIDEHERPCVHPVLSLDNFEQTPASYEGFIVLCGKVDCNNPSTPPSPPTPPQGGGDGDDPFLPPAQGSEYLACGKRKTRTIGVM